MPGRAWLALPVGAHQVDVEELVQERLELGAGQVGQQPQHTAWTQAAAQVPQLVAFADVAEAFDEDHSVESSSGELGERVLRAGRRR